MAEPRHPPASSPASSACSSFPPSSSSSPPPPPPPCVVPDPVRDAIPEEQLCPDTAAAGAASPARADAVTLPVPPPDPGGSASSSLALHSSPASDGQAEPEPSTSTDQRGKSSDHFPGQSPTLDASDTVESAEPASRRRNDAWRGLGSEGGSDMTLACGPPPPPPPPPPPMLPDPSAASSFVSPPPQVPALACSPMAWGQALPRGSERTGTGTGTAQVSVVAAEQPAGGFSAAVSVSFGAANAGSPQMSGAVASEESCTALSRLVVPASSLVACADEQVVLSEKQKGKLPARGPDSGAKLQVPLPLPPPLPCPPSPSTSSTVVTAGPSKAKMPWNKSPDRPLQKLHIRFKDAMGRNHLWPWKVAKTWKGAKRLIDAAFKHVDVIGGHVLAGHFDLFIHHAWEEPPTLMEASTSYSIAARPAKKEMSAVVSPIVVVDQQPTETGTSPTAGAGTPRDGEDTKGDEEAEDNIEGAGETSTASWSPPISSSSSFVTASPPPSPHVASAAPVFPPPPPPPAQAASPPDFPDLSRHGVFLLPELWDDVIEPGMYISMHLWPFPNNPATGHPVAPPLNPPLPPPPPPPVWITGPGVGPPGVGPGPGRGRGRGRGGGGRGGPPMMPSGTMPPPPPGWPSRRPPIIISIPKPKAKTRKRQDGL